MSENTCDWQLDAKHWCEQAFPLTPGIEFSSLRTGDSRWYMTEWRLCNQPCTTRLCSEGSVSPLSPSRHCRGQTPGRLNGEKNIVSNRLFKLVYNVNGKKRSWRKRNNPFRVWRWRTEGYGKRIMDWETGLCPLTMPHHSSRTLLLQLARGHLSRQYYVTNTTHSIDRGLFIDTQTFCDSTRSPWF
jgi:hypothetical protein